MTFLKKFTHFCVIAALGVSGANAQNTRKVAFRTLCLEQLNGIDKVLLPGAKEGDSQEVKLYTDLSPVIEGNFKTNEAAFFVAKPPGPDGKPIMQLVGKVALGKSERQIFVFTRGKEGAGQLPYEVFAYDDDTKSFAMGNIRAINLAPVPIRFKIAGQLTPQIPPLKYAIFPHSKDVNDYNMYIVVVQFLSGNGEWIDGQSVSWKALENRREIVITSLDAQSKQPAVQKYADFPPWMETPAAPQKP